MRSALLSKSIVAAMLSTSAVAQSFREAVDLALTTEPTYLSAKASSAASQEKSRQAYAGFLPQITASANANSNHRNYQTRDGLIPGAVDHYTSHYGQVNLTQPIYRATNPIALRQAETVVSQAHQQLLAAEQELLGRLVAAWCDTMAARDAVLFYNRQVEATRRQTEILRRGVEVGTAAAPALEDARAKYEQAVSDKASSEMEYQIRIAALEQLLGPVPSFVPPFLSYQVKVQSLAGEPLQEWLQRAERSPQVLAAAEALGAANEEIRKQRAGYDPTLDLVGSYSLNSQPVGNFPGQAGYDIRQSAVGLQLSIPLYSGGGQNARVGEAVALREKARQDLVSAQRAARLAVKQAWYGAQAGTTRHVAAAQAVKSAVVALRAASLGTSAGLKTELDVLQARQQLEGAKRDLNRARYDLTTSLVKLKAAAGELNEDDLALLSRMFVRREADPEELLASN